MNIDMSKIEELIKNPGGSKGGGGGGSRDPKKSPYVKALEAGEMLFRAVKYPHSEDSGGDPFLQRWYHFGLPGGTMYCPKRNKGEDCHCCDFVWGEMSANKGNKEEVKKWAEFLPKLNVLIPGVIRGREDEGAKFLRVSTRDDKPSDRYIKIYKWFLGDDTKMWLDAAEGYDMELVYEKPDASMARRFRANLILKKEGGVGLARTSTKFGTKKAYEAFLESIPNVDVDMHEVRDSAYTLETLKKWRGRLSAKQVPRADVQLNSGAEVVVSETTVTDQKVSDSAVTDQKALDSKLTELGL